MTPISTEILRHISGGMMEHGLWRRRYNFELHAEYGYRHDKFIKLGRLRGQRTSRE